jgi:hypothetical protein
MNPTVIIALCALASMLGSGIAAFVVMKVGVAKLETWKDFADGNINRTIATVGRHGDDILIHDVELGNLHQSLGMERVRRQMVRD